VYWPVGVNSGGRGLRLGRSARGSPMMFQMMWNWDGNVLSTGLIFSATGLYFLVVLIRIS
jgi:hypothetical protein